MSIHFHEKLFTTTVASGVEEHSIMLEANLCRLNDNSLFMTWTCGGDREPCEENITRYAKSYDNGRSWQDHTVLFSHPRKGMFTPEVFPYQNKIIAFPGSYYNGTYFAQDCHAYISYSEDNSVTFTSPASIGNAINNVHAKDSLVLDKRILVACSWIEGTDSTWACFDGANKPCIVAGKELFPSEDGLFCITVFTNRNTAAF